MQNMMGRVSWKALFALLGVMVAVRLLLEIR